jgi:hypothetical protein
MIAQFDCIAAEMSQKPTETSSNALRDVPKRFYLSYVVREHWIKEIGRIVGENENLWKSEENSVEFMLPYLYRSRYTE